MKKIICCVLCACVCMSLTGCDIVVKDEESSRKEDTELSRKEYKSLSDNDIYEFVDPDTGVHYWIYSHSGYRAGMGGMTPRLASDGSVMVTK